jgi:aminopeptidase N
VWEARTPELARSAARLLFPSTVVTADVLAEVDRLLARTLPAGLRRVVLEQRDDLARALRGRAVDETGTAQVRG